MIYSGTLTETLNFYRVVETQSESGFKKTEERFLFSTRAYRTKNKENYEVDAKELFHVTELKFQFRYRDVKETDIVVYNGERYRIISIDPYRAQNQITIVIAKINE